MADEFKIPENMHESNERAIAAYVLTHHHQLTQSETARKMGLSVSGVSKLRKKGFELVTLSKGAPYILELSEEVWRPLHDAGYRRKEDIKNDILNGKIDVYHEEYGGGGTIRGIGRARLYELKGWLGLPTGESKRAKGEKDYNATGKPRPVRRADFFKQDVATAKRESASDMEFKNRLRVIAVQHSLTYKHNQSTVLHILNAHKRRRGYSTHEAATILGISKRNLQNQIRLGRIKRSTPNNLFTRQDLLRWAAENLNGWAILELIDKGESLDWKDEAARKGADTWAGLVSKHTSVERQAGPGVSGTDEFLGEAHHSSGLRERSGENAEDDAS